MNADYVPVARTYPPMGRLWSGLLLSPSAWVANELVGWLISAQACQDGDAAWGFLGPVAVRILVGAVGLVALGVALAGAFVALRCWREISADRDLRAVQALDSREFLAVAGLMVSAAFAGSIVLFTLPALMLELCAFAR